MSFLSNHKLRITPLSPVHIGSNETYEPTNYIMDQVNDSAVMFVFKSDQALEALTEEKRKELLTIASGKPTGKLLRRVQRFFYENRNDLIAQSSHFIKIDKGIMDFYKERIGQISLREGRGKNVINRLEIERTFFNQITHLPFLPGTSVKGSIRTALLDFENKGQTQRNEKNNTLQQKLLKFTPGHFELDPFRLVSVSDAIWQKEEKAISNEILFALNRKKKATDADGNPLVSMAEKRNLYQVLECVAPFIYQAFETLLTIQKVDDIRDSYDKLPAPSLRWSIKDIAQACNRFYFPQFQKEKEILNQLGYLDGEWDKTINTVWALMAQKIADGNAFFLRVGRHSGAESVTLNNVRSIKIMKEEGNKDFKPLPTTYWLAANSRKAEKMIPFGWMLVEIDQPADHELEMVMSSYRTAQQEWRTSVQAYQSELRKKREEENLKQAEIQKKKEEARLKAEEEQRKKEEFEKAEKVRRANLSEIDLIIDDLLNKTIDYKGSFHELLEKYSGTDQKRIAETYKQLLKREGEWEVKPKKKKQFDRVQKIKSILGNSNERTY